MNTPKRNPKKTDPTAELFQPATAQIPLEALPPPNRGVAEIEHLVRHYHFFLGRQTRLHKLGETLSGLLPTLERTEAELDQAQRAVALEKEKLIVVYAGELGRTAFAGLESGELPEYPVFTERLDLQWKIESLERQRAKLMATRAISIFKKARQITQRIKLEQRIRQERSLIRFTNQNLGEEILIADENWSFECSHTAGVLPAINDHKKRIDDLRERVSQIQQQLIELRLTAAQNLGRPEVLETEALRQELEQTRLDYLENRSEIDAYRTLIANQIAELQGAGQNPSVDQHPLPLPDQQTPFPDWLPRAKPSPYIALTKFEWSKKVSLIAGIAALTLVLLTLGINRPSKGKSSGKRLIQTHSVAPAVEPETQPVKLRARQTNGRKPEQPVQPDPVPAGLMQEITNSIGMKLVLIPSGSFTMGGLPTEEGFQDHERAHPVTLTQDYWLAAFEVTQAQYVQVMGLNPSRFQGEIVAEHHPLTGNLMKEVDTSDYPVEKISWFDAVEFCQRLSELPEEKQAGRVYRLPTEAEWEYACRAGSQTAFYCGDSKAELYDHAWFGGNSSRKTHPVGLKNPNAWGLYDMHGNVMEWCLDNFADYPQRAVVDPVGLTDTPIRIRRGGAWCDIGAMCRSAHRDSSIPSRRSFDTGFRVAMSLSKDLSSSLAQ
jgi:formylglycine-generating enzyme required for sulfatase activity